MDNETPVYKDTVIIGNGPSAISLSYMLSGNVAYYKGQSDDDLLHNRMNYLKNVPIVLQDLKELSQGLEGRSSNYVSLLFDALAHPNADLGNDTPSLLDWQKREDLKVDHVVIGPDVPGGAWRAMDKDVLTVSLGTWMELPNLPMSDWLAKNSNSTNNQKKSFKSGDRISVGAVADYYKDYVDRMDLSHNFVNRAKVTRVRKVSCNSLRKAAESGRGRHICRPEVEHSHSQSNRHGGGTVFKFSEDIPALPAAASAAPPVGPSEDFTMMTSSSGDDVTTSTTPSSTGGFLSSLSSSFTTSSGGGGNYNRTTSPIPAAAAVASAAAQTLASSRNSNSTSSPEQTEVDNFDQDEYLEWRGNVAPEETYALSRTPMGHLVRVQAEANAAHKCCLRRSSDYSASALTCTSWNPICNPALFTSTPGVGPMSGGGEGTCGSPMVEAQKILERVSGVDYHNSHVQRCPVVRRRMGKGITCPRDRPHLWEVSGDRYDPQTGLRHNFKYLATNVVMACGSDKPNKMDIPGEDLPFVLHSLKELESKLASGELSSGDRVMVVGAGLSAADAVITALENKLKVLHMFRRGAQDKNLIFKSLPPKLYPEYHRVHQMMARGRHHDADYQPLERQHLTHIHEDKRVKFHGDVTTETVDVSNVVVLIGGRPNLQFFGHEDDVADVDPESLGVVPDTPVSKNNPVDIDIYTFESVKHSGLYAMGPLVGDNFVRFLQGGALAITSNILRRKQSSQQKDSSSS